MQFWGEKCLGKAHREIHWVRECENVSQTKILASIA